MFIVTYHAVGPVPSPVCVTPAQLESDLRSLSEAGFTVITMDECAEWLSGARRLPARSVAVTFDDAYASVVTAAVPILCRLGVPATVYAIAERIGADNRWPGQWTSIAPMPLADGGQLRELVAAGVAIGSHSSSHAKLTSLDDGALLREVGDSRDQLEQLLEVPVRHFAYPYGIRGAREIAAVRGHYRTAVNTEAKVVTGRSDPHDLSRIDGHDLHIARRLRIFDAAALAPYLAVRRGLRQVRRQAERIGGRA